MDIAARLSQFRDYTELSNSQFADKAGIPRPTLSQFLNGRNKRLSDDLAMKLHIAYPRLNMLWLLFGEGSMLVDGNFEISESKNPQKSLDFGDESIDLMGVNPTKQHDSVYTDSESIRKNNTKPAAEMQKSTSFQINPQKTVQYVMVFYSDNSFEVFRPEK